jgi:predicted DNA-binding antitoxin AbrB/MazE fold protein
MATYVEAVFEHGAFVPETPLNLPEGTWVVLTVSPRPGVEPPTVTDPEERAWKDFDAYRTIEGLEIVNPFRGVQ